MDEVLFVSIFTVGVGLLSTLLVFPLGVCAGWCLARKNWPGKSVVEAVMMVPLVIPPVATGLILLHLLGRQSPLGQALDAVGIEIIFTWKAVLIAMAVMSFPLMLRASKVAFEEVDQKIEDAAKTLGASPWDNFLSVTLPLARRGLLAGALLAFARALGEFGATVMIAGMIPGRTITLALGIYHHVQLGRDDRALVLLFVAVLLSVCAVWLSNWISRDSAKLI